ncbi:hypothetical protein ACFSTH_08515 [Paenibacillus yanchengensis]|uniref:Uncharacterized protein n=1 Tax=Paenibacillus yanchengensis TaxID=2035833 RepID=A0ABW4YLE8_9BACL
MKNKLILSAVIFGLIAVIVLIFLKSYDFPTSIDITKSAVAFVGDSDYPIENTTVRIKGVFYRPVFDAHFFEGKIAIEQHEFTDDFENLHVPVIKKRNGVEMSSLFYTPDEYPFPLLGSAVIYFSDNFESFNIIANGEWVEQPKTTRYYIVSGESMEDVYKLQKKQAEKWGEELMVAPQFRTKK